MSSYVFTGEWSALSSFARLTVSSVSRLSQVANPQRPGMGNHAFSRTLGNALTESKENISSPCSCSCSATINSD